VTTGESERAAGASRLMRRVPAVVLVVAGIGTFQTGAVIATGLFDSIGPAGAALLRLLFAAAIMVAVWYPLPWPLSRAQWRAVAFFGVVLGTMNLSYFEAIDRIPLGTAVTIQFAGPLALALIGRRSRLDVLWVVLAGGGILALVSPGGSSGEMTGYVFAAIAAFGWAGYIVGARRLGSVFDDSRGLALGMIAACFVPLVPGLLDLPDATLGWDVLPLGIAVALLLSVIPHTFDTEALRRLPAGVFGVLMSLEPVIASLMGAVLLGQLLSLREWVGVALVVIAAVGIMWPRGQVVEHA
jgi:inner membrane transporter RhtA